MLDARGFLEQTYGYSTWVEGQDEYEILAGQDSITVDSYRVEIDCDRAVYTHYQFSGRILDCGGGEGALRQFLAWRC